MHARYERAQSAALDARRIAHRINNDFSVLHGLLDIFGREPGLTAQQRADIAQMAASLDSMDRQFKAMHALIRGINNAPLPPEVDGP